MMGGEDEIIDDLKQRIADLEADAGVMKVDCEIQYERIKKLEALKVKADKAVNALYDTNEAMWLHAKAYLKAAKELDNGCD